MAVVCKCGRSYDVPPRTRIVCVCGFSGSSDSLFRIARAVDTAAKRQRIVQRLRNYGKLGDATAVILAKCDDRTPQLRRFLLGLLAECGCTRELAIQVLNGDS